MMNGRERLTKRIREGVARPALGQRVKVTHKLERKRTIHSARWEFIEYVDEGIYIGKRTYANGDKDYAERQDTWSGAVYIDYDSAPLFVAEQYFEVWLVVTSEHKNPIAVLPKHCALVDKD